MFDREELDTGIGGGSAGTTQKGNTEGARHLRLALPKGRMQVGVAQLLADAGIPVQSDARGYRPKLALADVDAKLLKPQAIAAMLAAGTRDLGFCGADWVAETRAEVELLLDTGLDPVRLVVAAPPQLLCAGELPRRSLRVASEYANLAQSWVSSPPRSGSVLSTCGATEVYPPEDADCILDNTATGSTLKANGLVIVDEIMRSTTCLYASRRALRDPDLRSRIDDFVMLLAGVVEARSRCVIELNVRREDLDAVVRALPAMLKPTLAPLHGDFGFGVKVAVRRDALVELIPNIRAAGARDIMVSSVAQIINARGTP